MVFILTISSQAAFTGTKKVCVFDLLGANGPVFAQMKDYKTVALDWGVELVLKPYTSERVAAEDFKSGLCDAVSFTGIRSRQFNSFTGSLDAVGAIAYLCTFKISNCYHQCQQSCKVNEKRSI